MNKKTTILLVYCLLHLTYGSAQDFNAPDPKKKEEPEEPFWSWDRVYFGGGLGGGMTQYETALNLSPDIGYRITKKFSVGIGGVYNYYEDRSVKPVFKLNIYGGSLFSRFLITDFLFAHAEYQPLNGPWDYPYTRRFFIHNVWVGGGLRQKAGDRASFLLTVLWNVNESIYSYPLSPQIRIGFNVGI